MAATSGLLDPTKPGKLPVILSDALLGKPSKETYTGIRYNHRPTLSSETAPATARLKKSAKDDTYNLGFEDQGDKYQYNGVRTTDDGNYVLIYDPVRKALVLHRVDSTFHMNITRTPTDTNAESLRNKFPHLEVKTPISRAPKGKAAQKAAASKTAASKARPGKANASPSVADDQPKTIELTLPDLSAAPPPEPKPAAEPPASQSSQEKKPKRRALSPVESEEEDDDDDGGLEIEYPEGNPAAFQTTRSYMPTIPVMTRRFSEFANERDDDDDDFDTRGPTTTYEMPPEEDGYEEEADYEEDEEDDEPSGMAPTPAALPPKPEIPPAVEPEVYTFEDESDADANVDELEGELAELEREFETVQNGHESDSSVSEEE